MKHCLSILVLFTLALSTKGQQNLVPNPSFEEYFRCPDPFGVNSNGLGSYVYDWENVFVLRTFNRGGSYFNSCSKDGLGVPTNMLGFQIASTGNAYACIWNQQNSGRNYFRTKLIKSMQKGKLYHVSFKINPADSSAFFMNKFGMNFYTQPTIIDPGPERLIKFGEKAIYPNKAHVYSNQLLDFVTQWYNIESDFVADSNYSYLILGNFWSIDSIKSVRHFWGEAEQLYGIKTSLYFIDDVEVIEIKQLRANKQKICFGDSVLVFSYKVNSPVFWKQNNNSADTLSKSDSIWVSPPTTTTYYLYTIENTLVDSITIEVFKKPENRILPFDTILCKNKEVILSAQYDGAFYKWSTGDTTPQITISRQGKYTVKIGLPDCNITETATASICATTFFVPTAFTPNGDGLNDEFKPVGIRVEDYQLQIFDRWGREVFKSDIMDIGWDGNNASDGAYAYVINYKDNKLGIQTQTGMVQLIR